MSRTFKIGDRVQVIHGIVGARPTVGYFGEIDDLRDVAAHVEWRWHVDMSDGSDCSSWRSVSNLKGWIDLADIDHGPALWLRDEVECASGELRKIGTVSGFEPRTVWVRVPGESEPWGFSDDEVRRIAVESR